MLNFTDLKENDVIKDKHNHLYCILRTYKNKEGEPLFYKAIQKKNGKRNHYLILIEDSLKDYELLKNENNI